MGIDELVQDSRIPEDLRERLIEELARLREAKDYSAQQEKLLSAGKMAGFAAHEINNMVTPIIG
jgi:C4-dicarboxylate-specific signal transduction histidine kinase